MAEGDLKTIAEIRFKQAAYSYVLGGIGTVFLTLTFLPASHYRRGIPYLLPGIILLLIIGFLIYREYLLLTRIIAILAVGRTLLFTLNFLLREPIMITLPFTDPPRRVILIMGTENPIFLIMAVITGFIAFMLLRAGWGRD